MNNLDKTMRMGGCLFLMVLCAPLACSVRSAEPFTLTSMEQENKLGEETYQEILQKEKVNKDPVINAFVQRVAKRIAAAAPDKGFQYEVAVLDSPQVNAFCLPGGKICVYTGILPYCENEAALACVMGHEVAHAILRHGGVRMTQNAAVSFIGIGLNKILQMQQVGATTSTIAKGVYNYGTQLGILLPYSRTHEVESDEAGLMYMALAGYDPREGARFWQRFSVLKSNVPSFLSTHPAHDDRVQRLTAMTNKALLEYLKAPDQYGLGERIPAKYLVAPLEVAQQPATPPGGTTPPTAKPATPAPVTPPVLLPMQPLAEESATLRKGTYSVDLPKGRFYKVHVPESYEPDGSWGVFLLLHGTNGTPDTQFSCFHHGIRPDEDFFVRIKCIGVGPKSVDKAWENADPLPLEALDHFLAGKDYVINKNRIHVLGVSSGGFAAGRIAYERPALFKTATIVAASLLLVNKGAINANPKRPIFFINGETDNNAKFASADYALLTKAGNRNVRQRLVAGQGHGVAYWDEFDRLFGWYKAMEDGFDYAKALDSARAKVAPDFEGSIKLVREIEKHPEEEVFWAELAKVRDAINVRGEEKLAVLLKTVKDPTKLLAELRKFAQLLDGFPAGAKASEEIKKIENTASPSK